MEIALKEDPTNVKNEQLLGTVILSSEGKPFVWKIVDITSEHENNTAVINKTEAILTELKNKEITVCAIVTDSASAYAAARLLKIQQELQILAINFKPPIVKIRRQQGETPTLPCEIFEIIDSSTFWDQITLINEILDSYCKLLNLLQCDKYYISVSTNELGFVAYRIFGIYVNAASIKRLWNCMGFLQTNWRNRLMSSKALQMSKLRAEITYGHRLHNNPPSIEPTLDINNANETDINQHFNNINGLHRSKSEKSGINQSSIGHQSDI
ncbi:hypothetical protein RhiirA1_473067 [Rhizophagus irregularis]|uniref:DUF659 domain-containing protein n=1 Tax=Rhizophagus irregularis TaxID=588596 RepID=A0A2N0R1B2_9GLOM|nr:hypothetical protein RhiirA1_473067 [Rhizophagus irregularis]